VARNFFANWKSSAQGGFVLLAAIAGGIATLSDVQSQGLTMTTSETLGANARQAMIDIFRKKVPDGSRSVFWRTLQAARPGPCRWSCWHEVACCGHSALTCR